MLLFKMPFLHSVMYFTWFFHARVAKHILLSIDWCIGWKWLLWCCEPHLGLAAVKKVHFIFWLGFNL